MTMRIGIDGRVLMRYEMRGFARYTVELFRAMKEVASDRIELVSFSPEPIALEFREILQVREVTFSARREILWEQIELPRRLRKHGVDVFHATANRGLPYARACKYVLTCHDVIDRLPEYCGGDHWRGRWRKKYADFASLRSADKVLTVSQFSKNEICRVCGVQSGRVAVILSGVHSRFHELVSTDVLTRTQRKYNLPASYFLYLGGFDRRKNVGALVEAFALLPDHAPSLVLAGEQKWEFPAVKEQIRGLGLAGRILCPGKIEDEELPALYQGALAFVYPSIYEGFGLQILEAMACGVPVLAADATSLPEVAGDGGLLFDPRDPKSIAQTMERIYYDRDLRHALAMKGRERASVFSWHSAARQTLDLYAELLGRRDAPFYQHESLTVANGYRG